MLNSINSFKLGIKNAREQATLHAFLNQHIPSLLSYDDLLRYQLVYAVSAFDKLIHDLIRIGMVGAFMGTRTRTPKFRNEPITLEFYDVLSTAIIPPKETLFEQEITRKLSFQSFQDPDKVSEGLSYIWPEKHKWQKISSLLSLDEMFAKTRLKLIIARRNSIVHEADFDPVTGSKTPIDSNSR